MPEKLSGGQNAECGTVSWHVPRRAGVLARLAHFYTFARHACLEPPCPLVRAAGIRADAFVESNMISEASSWSARELSHPHIELIHPSAQIAAKL